MNIREALEAVEELGRGVPQLFEGAKIDLMFGSDLRRIGDWSVPTNPGILIHGDGIGSRSGIYFFTSPEGEIIYIGKATKDNLHDRVWGHVKTPEETDGESRTFPNNTFRENRESAAEASHVGNGNAGLAVLTVSVSTLVSFIEVYLQTLHVRRHGCLPALNRQIG